MNDKGMTMMAALDGVRDEMLLDALPPGMGVYEKKEKSHRLSGFFDRPWVTAVVSASVALMVLSGILWMGQRAAQSPGGPSGEIGGQPGRPDTAETLHPIYTDQWPDYDNPPVPDDAKVVISSKGYRIAPAEYLQWKQVWDDDSQTFREERGAEQWLTYLEGADSGFDPSKGQAAFQSLPRLPYDGSGFSLEIPHTSLRLMTMSAYSESLRHAFSASLDEAFDSAWSVEDVLRELQPGTYCILLLAYDQGSYAEAGGGYEDAMYEFLFVVDIRASGETSPPVEPPVTHPCVGIHTSLGSVYFESPEEGYNLWREEWRDGQMISSDGPGAEEMLGKMLHIGLANVTHRATESVGTPIQLVLDHAGDTLRDVTVYDQELNYLDNGGLSLLAGLPTGTYVVVLTVESQGNYIPEADVYEGYCTQYLFVLTLQDRSTEPLPEPPPQTDVWGAVLLSGNRQIQPLGQNEWSVEALTEALAGERLPQVVYDKTCLPVFAVQGCYVVGLTLYRVDGQKLTPIGRHTVSDLDILQSVADGDYCVVFDVQRADPQEEGSMLLRSYAFRLWAGYEASSGEVETSHPTYTEPDYEDFSFALTWNTYGISSYDSQTGELIKTRGATNPEAYVTDYRLTDEDKAYFYEVLTSLDVYDYPDVYDPQNGASKPSMTLILTLRINGRVKTIKAENISLIPVSQDEKGQRFLSACEAISNRLEATAEWKALPDYENLYE